MATKPVVSLAHPLWQHLAEVQTNLHWAEDSTGLGQLLRGFSFIDPSSLAIRQVFSSKKYHTAKRTLAYQLLTAVFACCITLSQHILWLDSSSWSHSRELQWLEGCCGGATSHCTSLPTFHENTSYKSTVLCLYKEILILLNYIGLISHVQ